MRNSCLIKLLICFGLFILIQDLIVENVGPETIHFKTIKIVDEIFILAIFILILTARLTKGRFLIKTAIDYPLIGLIMVGLASSLVSGVSFFITFSQFFLIIKGFLIFYIFANLRLTEDDVKKFVKIFGIFAIIVMFLGFVDLIIPEQFRELIGNRTFIDWRGGIPSVKSIFVYPATFGWYMAFACLYASAFFFILQKRKYLFFALLFFMGVFLSMRIKNFSGLTLALLGGVFCLTSFKKLKYLFLIFVAGITLLTLNWSRFESLYDLTMERDFKRLFNAQLETRTARVELYRKGFTIGRDYFPLGAGLGRYGSWMARVHYSPLYEQYGLSEVYGLEEEDRRMLCDTFWPMIIGETGFVGLFFYLWIIMSLLLFCHSGFKHSDTVFKKAFCLGVFMIVLEALIESFSTPFWVKPPMAYFVFASVGICYSLFRCLRLNNEGFCDENIVNQ